MAGSLSDITDRRRAEAFKEDFRRVKEEIRKVIVGNDLKNNSWLLQAIEEGLDLRMLHTSVLTRATLANSLIFITVHASSVIR